MRCARRIASDIYSRDGVDRPRWVMAAAHRLQRTTTTTMLPHNRKRHGVHSGFRAESRSGGAWSDGWEGAIRDSLGARVGASVAWVR